MTELTFTVVIEEDTDSGYVARCLELRGIYGQGETEEETLKDIQQALDAVLETYSIENIKMPYHKVVQVTRDIPSAPSTS